MAFRLPANLTTDELRTLYWDKGLTQTEIAKLTGIDRRRIRGVMREAGIPIRNCFEASSLAEQRGRRVHVKTAQDKLSVEKVKHLYLEKMLSDKATARLLGISKTVVWRFRRKWGIPSRDKMKAAWLSRWKGGRYQFPDGYIFVKLPRDNPFYEMADQRGYVFEHRLVMARHLGRPLQRGEIVHHKNGVRDDNRIENLELVPTCREHTLIRYKNLKEAWERINQLEKRVTILEAENVVLRRSQCSDCRQT